MAQPPDWQVRRQRRRRKLLGGAVVVLAGALVGLLGRGQRPAAPPVPAHVAPLSPAAPTGTLGGLPAVWLSGTPAEIGRQHGVYLKSRVQQVVALSAGWLKAAGLGREAALAHAKAMTAGLRPTLVDELRALAAGAGVREDDLLLVQCLPDLCGWRTGAGYALASPACRGRDVLVGWALERPGPVGVEPLAAVLAVSVEGGTPWVGVALAGMVGPLVGMSSKGLALAALPAGQGTEPAAGPLVATARGLLEDCRDTRGATTTLRAGGATVGANWLLGQAQPAPGVLAIERRGDQTAERAADSGRLVATNHFRALGRSQPLRDAEAGQCPRFDALRAWLADRQGRLDADDDPVRGAGLATDGQLARVICEPVANRLWVAASASGALTALRWSPTEKKLATEPATTTQGGQP